MSASPEVASALQNLECSPSSDKLSSYKDLLGEILSSSQSDQIASNLIAYARSILNESLNLVASRPLLADFVTQFWSIQQQRVIIEVGHQVLELIQPRIVSFEEQDAILKEIVASAHEAEEDYTASARILQTITLDSSQRRVTADEKAKIWIRIVRCYLEDDDPTNAMAFLNRVRNVLYEVESRETHLYFKLSQARIFDSQRRFQDASTAYLAVSTEPLVDEDERLQILSHATVAAILAPAGPQRTNTLVRLYKDERASSLDIYPILEKIFLDRLLEPGEVKALEGKLAPHQLAKTADGNTVLDRAMLDHNLLAVSKLYANISTKKLGSRLGVSKERAEEYAAKMIGEGRLAGHIDQIDQVIFFDKESPANGVGVEGGSHKVFGKELRKWDMNVQGIAEEVERITTMIQKQNPEFYAAHMVQ